MSGADQPTGAVPIGYMRDKDDDGTAFGVSKQCNAYYTKPVFASSPQPVAPTGEIARFEPCLVGTREDIADCAEHSEGSYVLYSDHLAALTASEAEAADLRRKLEEHQDAEDKAAREMATVIQGLRNRATAAERKLEEAREALERAAVAAYDEPHYLGPEGMERGADGLLPPGSPYDRGRYDARKAVEVVTSQARESDNG